MYQYHKFSLQKIRGHGTFETDLNFLRANATTFWLGLKPAQNTEKCFSLKSDIHTELNF